MPASPAALGWALSRRAKRRARTPKLVRTRLRAAMRRASTTSREVRRGGDGETIETTSKTRAVQDSKRKKGLRVYRPSDGSLQSRDSVATENDVSGFGTVLQATHKKACRGTGSPRSRRARSTVLRASPLRTRSQSPTRRAVVVRAHPTDAREEQERCAARRTLARITPMLLSRRDFEHVDRRGGSLLGVHLGGASHEPLDGRGEAFARVSCHSSPDASRRLRARHGHGG